MATLVAPPLALASLHFHCRSLALLCLLEDFLPPPLGWRACEYARQLLAQALHVFGPASSPRQLRGHHAKALRGAQSKPTFSNLCHIWSGGALVVCQALHFLTGLAAGNRRVRLFHRGPQHSRGLG